MLVKRILYFHHAHFWIKSGLIVITRDTFFCLFSILCRIIGSDVNILKPFGGNMQILQEDCEQFTQKQIIIRLLNLCV